MAKMILLVEDDDDTRSIYETALSARGYRVVTATQGAEGVQFARLYHPDLIMLDLRMPVMSGWGAANYLKADPATRGIPVCPMSAYSLGEIEQELAQRVEFDAFLLKPATPDDFVRHVESHVGPPVEFPLEDAK